MAQDDGISVNGVDYSWGSIVFKCNGAVFSGFTKIAYSDKRTRTKGYSAGKHQAPTHRSRGKYEADPVKVTGYLDELQAFRAWLAQQSADGISYGNVEFQGCIQYEERDVLHQVDLVDLVWFEESAAHEENADLLMQEVSFDPMRILRDGLTLFDATNGIPQRPGSSSAEAA